MKNHFGQLASKIGQQWSPNFNGFQHVFENQKRSVNIWQYFSIGGGPTNPIEL